MNLSEYKTLFETHYTHLCQYSYQFTYNLEASKDIIQSIFIDVWEKRETMDENRSIRSYLFTSARNRSLNYIRDIKKRTSSLSIEDLEIPIISEEEPISTEEISKFVEKAMSQLTDRTREIFLMCRYQGLKYKEVAEELNVSQKNVEAHMSKAMRILKEYIKSSNSFYIVIIVSLLVRVFFNIGV